MAPVELAYVFEGNPVIVKNDELVPGYRCHSCEAEYYDAPVTLRLFQETLPKLDRMSDRRAALAARIKSLSKALA